MSSSASCLPIQNVNAKCSCGAVSSVLQSSRGHLPSKIRVSAGGDLWDVDLSRLTEFYLLSKGLPEIIRNGGLGDDSFRSFRLWIYFTPLQVTSVVQEEGVVCFSLRNIHFRILHILFECEWIRKRTLETRSEGLVVSHTMGENSDEDIIALLEQAKKYQENLIVFCALINGHLYFCFCIVCLCMYDLLFSGYVTVQGGQVIMVTMVIT